MTEHGYYLRSLTKEESLSTTSPISPTSPAPPPVKPISTPSKPAKRMRRRKKRTFSQIQTDSQSLQNFNLPPKKKQKSSKLIKKIKFNLNDKAVVSASANVSSTSPLSKSLHRPRIEDFESTALYRSHGRRLRRNPFCCRYSFFNQYEMGIKTTIGAAEELKQGVKILSQDLKSVRCKAAIHSAKNVFFVYLKNRKGKIIGCSILHVDHVWKRVIIEMFAIDSCWRGNGFASMMIFLIQMNMMHYNKYDLFVSAAVQALSFWLNPKYRFCIAHKNILEQHEVSDEKNGDTKHLIWFGAPVQARYALLQRFIELDQEKK